MRINHNIAALNTYRQLNSASTAQGKSMEKLSSGLRINRAGDDAAGLAISEKMRGQIRGLEQAGRNAQDSISLIQTAEGALNETHSILQRMRELAVQSANDTNTGADRSEIQKEINQLTSEVDRIATTTEFNTKKLLNGDSGAKVNFSSNANVTSAQASENTVAGTYAIDVTTAAEQATVAASAVFADADLTVASGTKSVEINGQSISFEFDNADAAATAANFKNAVNNANIGITVTGDGTTSALTLKTNDYGSDTSITIKASAVTAEMNLTSDATTASTDSGVDVAGTIGGVAASGKGLTLTGTGDAAGLKVNLTTTAASTVAAAGNVDVVQNALSTHIGANEGQQMSINISSMTTLDLGINSLDLESQSGAESAITTINDAIASVSGERSKLGAYQNRLEHTINNLGTSAENLTASESRIRDVDMAKEMMNQTKNSILSQAAQAMLAQANQQPQGVLQLLR
jgi:flagellin